MNRWTGTGHLTRDPKFLETENGTAICTLRIAVKRAGKKGQDGYFNVKCFDAQANACARYLKAGREVAVDGRLAFEEFQTADGGYASRVDIVGDRVKFLSSRKPTTGQAGDDTEPEAGRDVSDGVHAEAGAEDAA
jgi:single-strand DNA-binding protein